MATIQEKQAESLAVLKEYQDIHGENLVIRGADTLGRTHTERLVDTIRPIKLGNNLWRHLLLGHFIFVYIHPYMDGNGRMARFTMNGQLVTGGYPWVVVPVERRDEYMESLEKASVEEDNEPFVRFIVSLVA